MPFRLFVYSRQKYATRKDKKKKKSPCKKTEKHHANRRNFSAKKRKNAMRKDAILNFNFVVFLRGVFTSFCFFFFFAWRLFIFSPGVISSCQPLARRLFVFSRRKNAMRKDEKMKRRHAKKTKKKKKDEIMPYKIMKIRKDDITKRRNNGKTKRRQNVIC